MTNIIVPDEILADILFNNRIDDRNGISIISKPPDEIINTIQSCQEKISPFCPLLWWTPAENLHSTLLEIVHSCNESQVDLMLDLLEETCTLKQIITYLNSITPILHSPRLKITPSCIILLFSSDPHPISIKSYKLKLQEMLGSIEFPENIPKPRYKPTNNIHITIARFVSPATPSTLKTLKRLISDINDNLSPTSFNLNTQIQVKTGLNWYGGGNILQFSH